ncbi:MAG TPA: tyrosine-type recombinase/integrase, partial [Terriglobales bacterium]|nr:tyrosine-type recombinase/integrase [Terriglobales bacterium]
HQLLFPNKLGRPYNRGRVVKKILHPIFDKLGISRKGRRIGFHAFRHPLASLLAQTVGIMVAQRQLRHSNARTTLDIYTHILGDEHGEGMQKAEAVLLHRQAVASGTLRIWREITGESPIP